MGNETDSPNMSLFEVVDRTLGAILQQLDQKTEDTHLLGLSNSIYIQSLVQLLVHKGVFTQDEFNACFQAILKLSTQPPDEGASDDNQQVLPSA